jgi:CRISPR-associated endoribonuclease Cas6
MRIRVHLRAPPPIVIPLNYAHQLASVVYRLLDCSSSAYATFLHEQGYGTGDRLFKLFTFSPLFGYPRQVVAGHLRFETTAMTWSITSPVEAFIRHVVQGILSLDQLEIAGVTFAIAQVETLPEPAFTDEMRFTCLSPLTMSVRTAGQRWAQYLAPEDPQFAAAVRSNLERKCALVQALQGEAAEVPPAKVFSLTFDPHYQARHGGRISKLIDYKGTKIRGYQAPLTVTGPSELLRIGYACGFGDRNSQGFGMVEVARGGAPQMP